MKLSSSSYNKRVRRTEPLWCHAQLAKNRRYTHRARDRGGGVAATPKWAVQLSWSSEPIRTRVQAETDIRKTVPCTRRTQPALVASHSEFYPTKELDNTESGISAAGIPIQRTREELLCEKCAERAWQVILVALFDR